MRSTLIHALMGLLVAAAVPAGAQTSPPPGLSTPRSAAETLWTAISKGDVQKTSEALDAPGATPELRWAVAEVLVMGKRLSNAAATRFGASGGVIAKPMLTGDDLALLDSAEEKIDGDRATVTIAGQAHPMRFIRADGKWRLLVEQYADVPPEEMGGRVKMLRDLAMALNESAKDIEAGKWATPQEAERFIQDRLHAVTMERYRQATTGPTSRAIGMPPK